MKYVKKYIKMVGFLFLAFVSLIFVLVQADGTKNIVFKAVSGTPLTWGSLGTGFKIGTGDYVIYDQDNTTNCSYYRGLTDHKIYIPNNKPNEYAVFQSHFPTGFVEDQTKEIPNCSYKNTSSQPIDCYGHTDITQITTLTIDGKGYASWNCLTPGNPCKDTDYCQYTPCSSSGCDSKSTIITGSVTSWQCSVSGEPPRTFSCTVSSYCGNSPGVCQGITDFVENSLLATTSSSWSWNCKDRDTSRNYSCELSVCSTTYSVGSECINGVYVEDSYKDSSWTCNFEDVDYTCSQSI